MKWIKASERLPGLRQRLFLFICGEYQWTGDFIQDEGEEVICRVDGQNRSIITKSL